MIKNINLGDKKDSIEKLQAFKNEKMNPRFIRIINSRIKDLNKVIGRSVFRKDAVYINSLTLYEIMQPMGGKGKHNYHGLTPVEVYNALSRLKYSKNISISYLDRYVVITDVCVKDNVNLVIIITPQSNIPDENLENIVTIITIYPSDRENRQKRKVQKK